MTESAYLIKQVSKSIIASGLYFYLTLGCVAYYNIPEVIYQPGQTDFADCDLGADVKQIQIAETRAYQYTQQGNSKMLLHYHGSNLSACERGHYVTFAQQTGVDLILIEYCGYAGDVRKPSRDCILSDVRNIVSYVESLHYDEGYYLSGHSLGTGYVGAHTYYSRIQPDGLILSASFTQTSEVAFEHVPIFPTRWMLTQRGEELDNVFALKWYRGKVLIIHGLKDDVIPCREGTYLYRHIRTREKYFLLVENRGHFGLWSPHGGDVVNVMKQFMTSDSLASVTGNQLPDSVCSGA